MHKGSSRESVDGISLAATAKWMIKPGKTIDHGGRFPEGLSAAEYSYSRQDAKNAKGDGKDE